MARVLLVGQQCGSVMKAPKILTAAQRKLWNEAVEIAELGKVDFWNIEEVDKEFRLAALRLAIAHMVVGEIVTQYTLMDEILSEVISKYFFKTKDEGFVRWKTKKFRTFVHHISDEMYLIKKMELVHQVAVERCVVRDPNAIEDREQQQRVFGRFS